LDQLASHLSFLLDFLSLLLIPISRTIDRLIEQSAFMDLVRDALGGAVSGRIFDRNDVAQLEFDLTNILAFRKTTLYTFLHPCIVSLNLAIGTWLSWFGMDH
jgi:hypothetical protein